MKHDLETLWPEALRGDAALYDQMRSVLLSMRGQRVVLLLNRGNRGDGVIQLGARRLLKHLGIDYLEIHESAAPATLEADVLLVTGSGAFCRSTHTLISLLERYRRGVHQVIILPASFELTCAPVRRFVKTWDGAFTVFCRERRSFEGLRRLNVRPKQLLLSHDLAFCTDLDPWRARVGAGTVGIFRRDGEAVFDRRPRGFAGCDISRGPDTEAHVLLDYVARYAVIHTDRTHAAITGALLGREVWLYRNAYFKNEAIHEHSLVSLPNVHFVGRQPFSLRQFSAAIYNQYVQRVIYAFWRRGRDLRRWITNTPAPGRAG